MSATPSPIALFDMPHKRARALLASGPPVFVTVDPVEYHGPHLSLHNDHIMSKAVVRALYAGLAERSADLPFVVADAIPVGVEPVQGPGTRAVPYRTMREIVSVACHALAELGARNVVLVTSHGAPLHSIAIQHAVRELTARGVRAVAPLNVVLHDLVEPPEKLVDDAVLTVAAEEREALRVSLRRDFHAGFGETSLTLHWAPEAVDAVHLELPDVDLVVGDPTMLRAAHLAARLGRKVLARELEYASHGIAWAKMRPFPGYTGRPRLANPRAGAVLARFAEQRMLEATLAVLERGEPPAEPPMLWLERASLGGLIPGLSVPLDAVRVQA